MAMITAGPAMPTIRSSSAGALLRRIRQCGFSTAASSGIASETLPPWRTRSVTSAQATGQRFLDPAASE